MAARAPPAMAAFEVLSGALHLGPQLDHQGVSADPLLRPGCAAVLTGTTAHDLRREGTVGFEGDPVVVAASLPVRLSAGGELMFTLESQAFSPRWAGARSEGEAAAALAGMARAQHPRVPGALGPSTEGIRNQGLFWPFAEEHRRRLGLPVTQGHWARSCIVNGRVFWFEKRGAAGLVTVWESRDALCADVARVVLEGSPIAAYGSPAPAYVAEPIPFLLSSATLPGGHVLFTDHAVGAGRVLGAPGDNRHTRFELPTAPSAKPHLRGVPVNHDTGLKTNPETGLTPAASKYQRYELPVAAQQPRAAGQASALGGINITPSKPIEQVLNTGPVYRKTGGPLYRNKEAGNVRARYEVNAEFLPPRSSVRVQQPPGGKSKVYFG